MSRLLNGIAPAWRPPRESTAPSDSELDAAARIIARQPWTFANLVFLRDKRVVVDDERTGFLMYAVQGRTWVALGDPVGAEGATPALVRRFLERCSRSNGVPVFYEVRRQHLPLYEDAGLRILKLGEEARVDLTTFALTGRRWSKQRQHLARLARDGVTFRVVPHTHTPALIDVLRSISDEWLSSKSGGEKGFSLGSFTSDYVSRFDVAVMEREGDIIAFANVWTALQGFELGTDLIRYRAGAPAETMEGLLLHVMMWARARGYSWLSLGVAPLSGVARSPSALWDRVCAFVYAYGEGLYRFRGLRQFKEKFHPRWEPRYLAYAGSALRLPRTLADVAALIAGGYSRLLLK